MSRFLLDLSLSSPEENLACDELLLELAESRKIGEGLRLWESPVYFVVLGHAKKLEDETFKEACEKDRIKILRRISGGGTVLQGPGCLNYSLVLSLQGKTLADIQTDNCNIMKQIRNSLASLTNEEIKIAGVTDLTLGGLKFSGNAMRRLKNAMLFHGTVLYNFDFEKISLYLAEPSEQPEYRKNRPHGEFLTCLPASPQEIKRGLVKEWNAIEGLKLDEFSDRLGFLIKERYENHDWNFKF